MKKIVVRLIALTMVLTLLGCQGATNAVDTELEQTQATELQSIVETETLESESMLNLPVSTKTIAEMVQAPEKMVYEFENPNVYSEVGIDAEIVIPDVDGMDVVQISNTLTQDEVDKIEEQILHSFAETDSETWTEKIMKYAELIVENVELLSFDRIETIIEELIVEDLNSNKVDTALTRDSVDNICLEYGYVQDREADSDAIIPVWNCYDSSGSEDLKVLTINAIDGSILYVDKNTVSDVVLAPERMEYTVDDFEIDAEIILPDVAGMDVVSFGIDTMEAEEVSKLASMYMADDFEFFDERLIELSIEVVEELEDTWSLNKLVEDVNKEEAKNADQEKTYPTLEADEEDYLNNYEIVLKLLQAEECIDIPGFRYLQVERVDGETIDLYVAFIDSDECMGAIFVCNNEFIIYTAEKTSIKDMMQYLVLVYINIFTNYTKETITPIVDYEITDESIVHSYGSKLAPISNLNQKLLSDLNYNGYQQINYNPAIYYTHASFSDYSAMSYVKGYDDIPILGIGNSKYRICNEIVLGRENDRLWTLSVYPAITLGDIQSEFVNLLPFAQIESCIYHYMNSESFKSENEFVTGPIESIRLEYRTIFDETEEKGNIVPVWNFYYANSVTDKSGDLIYKENRYWLSVNAMDGTIIR